MLHLQKFFRLKPVQLFFLLIPVFSIWILFDSSDRFQELKNITQDRRLRIRGNIEAPKPITYVNMDSTFLSFHGQSPWHRGVFATTINALLDQGNAKAVFVDIVFSPITSSKMVDQKTIAKSDTELAQVTSRHSGSLVLAASYSTGHQLGFMKQKSFMPLIHEGNYDPQSNPYPEAPTYPIIHLNWGQLGLIDVNYNLNKDSAARYMVGFVEIDGEEHSLNLAWGFNKYHGIEQSVTPTETTFIAGNESTGMIQLPRNLTKTFYTAAIQTLCSYHGLNSTFAVEKTEDRLTITDYNNDQLLYGIPLVNEQMLRINYFNPWNSHVDPKYSMAYVHEYAELLAQPKENETWQSFLNGMRNREGGPPELLATDPDLYVERVKGSIAAWFKRFENRIVMIGPTDTMLQDVGPSPLDDGAVPRVFAHGNLVKTIMADRHITMLSQNAQMSIAALLTLSVCGFGLLGGSRSFQAKGVSVILLLLYLWLALYLFEKSDIYLPLVVPMGAALSCLFLGTFYQLFTEERQKGRIKRTFGTYVSPDLVNNIIDSGEEPKLGGENVEITAFFSDVQSFSTFSEVLKPDRLVELMNDYLNHMTNILHEEGGTLDKYIGDAIVAMFGAPVRMKNHALQGCVAAVRMQNMQAQLRKDWENQGDHWPPLVWQMQTRIGLNTGHAVVGNMGSTTRFNYTMMGDSVNLAARLESGAKQYGVYTLCAEDTKIAAQASEDIFLFRRLDKIQVKGRNRPVEVFELLAFKNDAPDAMIECVSLYEKGLDLYFEQRWDEAADYFLKSMKLESNQPQETPGVSTNPSLILHERCREMAHEEKMKEWDGVYIMKSK